MIDQDFKISIKTVWLLIIGNLFIVFIGALAKLQHWEFSSFLLSVGVILFFSTWIIIISDIVKNKIDNKVFWIFVMLFIPAISQIFYLIQRNRLLRQGQE